MKNKKLIKVFFVTILIFGTCYFTRLNVGKTLHNSKKESSTNSSELEMFATHYSIPYNFYGKKLPFHHVYETRRIKYPPDLQHTPTFSSKTKVILLWTPWNGMRRTINYYTLQPGNESFVKYNCPNQKCIATSNRSHLRTADAVLFYLLDTKPKDLPPYRSAHQYWILYNMEPPWLIKRDIYPVLPHLKNIFNWTMSYQRNSDVLARYGFIAPSNGSASYISFQSKTKSIVWFVSDCVTDSKREDYVKELNKYIDVDIYGTCGDHKCYPSKSSICYEKVLEKYKFYLSFENAICKDYVTEKFFNIFNYDIIPIVFGAANYSTMAPEGTFIDATQYSDPEKLATELLEISNNEDMYNSFLFNKRSFTAYLDPWMCRLCDKLHTNNKSSILRNVEEYWLEKTQCKTWNKTNKSFERSK